VKVRENERKHYAPVERAVISATRVVWTIGAEFNRPNFENPDNVLGDPTFGQISSMQPMPTSPYRVFLGFDSSVRVVQVSGKIIF
jgi:hypothetical protein